MAITVVAQVTATGDAATATTAAIDTTGATLLVMMIAWQGSGGGSVSVSDSKGNTWTALRESGSGAVRTNLYYATNVAGKVGTGHTFTVTKGGAASIFPGIGIVACAGAHATAPADQTNGINDLGATTSRACGSVTPTEDNEILVAGLTIGTAAISNLTIDSGFGTIFFTNHDADSNGIAISWLIQTTAATKNPTWSWTTSVDNSTAIGTFKVGLAAAGPRFSAQIIG